MGLSRLKTKDQRPKTKDLSAIIETEETLVIETPERVPLAFALASIGNRFLAAAIDHLIQFLSVAIVAFIFLTAAGVGADEEAGLLGAFESEAPKWMLALMVLVVFLLFTGYFIFFEWLWNGQTPGKRLLKLRVIRDDGRPITLR